jgi:hypothetical protein
VLQIGEKTFRSGEALSPTHRKYMSGLLAYLQKWLGMPATAPQPPKETPAPAQASAQSAPQSTEIPTASTKSIVEQIDEILQEKLLGTPLSDRGIYLRETIKGGMVISVGVDQYEEIDAISDEAVKQTIRAAVSEWEQQQ